MMGGDQVKAESWAADPGQGRQGACGAADQALAGETAGSLTASAVAVIEPGGAAELRVKSEQTKEGSLGLLESQGR